MHLFRALVPVKEGASSFQNFKQADIPFTIEIQKGIAGTFCSMLFTPYSHSTTLATDCPVDLKTSCWYGGISLVLSVKYMLST
jgi:hypothetical protein